MEETCLASPTKNYILVSSPEGLVAGLEWDELKRVRRDGDCECSILFFLVHLDLFSYLDFLVFKSWLRGGR